MAGPTFLDGITNILRHGRIDPPKAPNRPGAYQGQTVGTTSQAEQTQQTEIPTDLAGLQDAIDQASLMPQIQAKRAEIEQMAQLAKAGINPNAQLDLSPLAQLVDTWTGSKFAQGYQRPDSFQDIAKRGFGYASDIQSREDALRDEIRTLAEKTQPKGITQSKVMGKADDLKKWGFDTPAPRTPSPFQAEREQRMKEDKIRTDIDKTIMTPVSQRAEQFQNIDDAFASGDYQSVMAMLSQFSRGVAGEKGVLTDKDITRVMPSSLKGDVAKFKAYFSSTPSSQMDPEYTASLRKMVNIAKDNAARVYSNMTHDKLKGYKNSITYKSVAVDDFFSTPRERIRDSFGTFYEPGKAKPATPAIKTGGGLTPEQEKRRQELLRKAGK